MKAYGAEVVLTPGAQGMAGAIQKAEELAKEYKDSIIAGQFDNLANPEAHFKTTGPEIYEDTDGKTDIFVSAVGTGGTITGAGKYLKSKNAEIKVVAVEPKESPYLSEKRAGKHKIQGIGAGFVPNVLSTDVYDEIIAVSDDDAELPKHITFLLSECERLVANACEEFSMSLSTHDKIEEIYRDYVDYDLVNEEAEKLLKKVM